METEIALRSLFDVPLNATTGKETLLKARGVFTSHRDPNLKKWGLDKPGHATPKTLVTVYKMFQGKGTFFEICKTVSSDFNALCLTQGNIEFFTETHRDKLHPDAYATFFLFTRGDWPVFRDLSNLFVANVYISGHGPRVDIFPFIYREVWESEFLPRFVFPKLPEEGNWSINVKITLKVIFNDRSSNENRFVR